MNRAKRMVVTGAAGMIGSNLIAGLNAKGYDNIIAVDDLTQGRKFSNLAGLKIADYQDKAEFLQNLEQGDFFEIRCIFHQGACSATTEWNGQYMMENNYSYSKKLYEYCAQYEIPFIYASSASVYGDGMQGFSEAKGGLSLLNVYAYSKWLFDHFVSRQKTHHQVVGLRYFNVYGPNEQHKGSMASVAWHLHQQQLKKESLKLFGAWDGHAAGQQQRDFIYVGDAVTVNLWFLEHPEIKGIFNCGTGQAAPFQSIADEIVRYYGEGDITYIDFPEHLKGAYQSHTQADMSKLRQAGYTAPFHTLSSGMKHYLDHLTLRA